MDYQDILYKKNTLLILSYLSKTNKSIYGRMLSKELGLSQASISTVLKELEGIGIVFREEIGRAILYKVDKKSPEIQKFRIFENIMSIKVLVNQIKGYSREIVLFGSCASGDDDLSSDMDIFIVADEDNHSIIRTIISDYKSDRDISPIIVDTIELLQMEESDKIFVKEIYRGISLYSGEEN
ncbi:hypothetical protein E9840_05840 [Tissierella creatinini]|nr:hypothetical protein E9840_05840 [Tissierella creatinini]TJX60676.1 hypothetical protein E8P77_19775 [Soehngenia saccharolytica]